MFSSPKFRDLNPAELDGYFQGAVQLAQQSSKIVGPDFSGSLKNPKPDKKGSEKKKHITF